MAVMVTGRRANQISAACDPGSLNSSSESESLLLLARKHKTLLSTKHSTVKAWQQVMDYNNPVTAIRAKLEKIIPELAEVQQ